MEPKAGLVVELERLRQEHEAGSPNALIFAVTIARANPGLLDELPPWLWDGLLEACEAHRASAARNRKHRSALVRGSRWHIADYYLRRRDRDNAAAGKRIVTRRRAFHAAAEALRRLGIDATATHDAVEKDWKAINRQAPNRGQFTDRKKSADSTARAAICRKASLQKDGDASMLDHMLKMPAVCAVVQQHQSTIYRLIARGEFPKGVRISKRSRRWPESQIRSWLASRKQADSSDVRSPNPRKKPARLRKSRQVRSK